MTERPLEFTDEIVAQFLERVEKLFQVQRDLLDTPRSRRWVMPPLGLLFPTVKSRIGVQFGAYIAVRLSMMNATPEARQAYLAFWQQLAGQGWSATGKIPIGLGLFAVRTRKLDPAEAQRRYQLIDPYIPHQALGWVWTTAA